MNKPKELKLYKCWECNDSYYASEMTTTDKKKEVGDFCKECWKDIKELADPFLDEYLQEIKEKNQKALNELFTTTIKRITGDNNE